MFDGVIAAVLFIGAFIAFIVWGRSTAGQALLRNRFGEPGLARRSHRAFKASARPKSAGQRKRPARK